MNKKLKILAEISQYYGKRKEFVIAGGGNTSFKTEERLWVKASGYPLSDITEEGFAMLDRAKLRDIGLKNYSEDIVERENQVKQDLAAANLTPDKRPSVETSLHDAIDYSYVVHLHPTAVNGLMCSNNAQEITEKILGDEAVYIPYIDPGYTLFKEVQNQINSFRAFNGFDPKIILLQNHGIFVASDDVDEIKEIYDRILSSIYKEVKEPIPEKEIPIADIVTEIVPAIRMIVSDKDLKVVKIRNNDLIRHFSNSYESFRKIQKPFTPDIIVYCKSEYLYLDKIQNPESVVEQFEEEYQKFVVNNGYPPKVVLIKNLGLLAIDDNSERAEIVLDVFEDMLKISWLTESFGGQHFMTDDQIGFIDQWEVENYRRSVAAKQLKGRVENRTFIITGAAQGFGEGIGKELKREGANIVIADLNEEKGRATANNFNSIIGGNKAIFVKTDVSDLKQIEHLVKQSIINFGAVDALISNAGILRAGSLDEMTTETFDLVTKINYNAYFYCTKAVSKVMKLQTAYSKEYFADIIQINSKSGLSGSKKNFAYAGGKFGGIGLTQSFALELAPYRIKVNSICPGNFYDGPLWSDPQNGLFVQYLNAGKVPGAQNLDDVKQHYLNQTPIQRGCTVNDVLKAVLYLIDQDYETGQALPVTGGQVMLK